MAWSPDAQMVVKHTKHSEELDDWVLILPKVRKSDAGLYECQLTSVGGYHTHVQLNIVGPPITDPAVSLTGEQYVERGEQIKLTCNATGGKQIADQIDWFKDGNIIAGPQYKDYIIFTYRLHEHGALVSTLQVDRATTEHAGTYVCRSSYNKLKDIAVQVLVAERDNVKRGTVSSNNSSPCPVQRSTICILFCLVVTQLTLHD
ncbi:zwei Ig domain protein zig-8 [Aplysia californica]|uniref:Zwei Ig domain protein zig-8 n=1 Tax=Aplysia californica TaxID=6500 RepID=A0ABM0ZX18_APLCA|nr:zwei Ig domain protein zig-8 [Aplysia californica]